MTRVQFLNDLYRRLGALEKAQAEEWLVYYAEMLADRMEEGMTEEEAVGSMEDLDTIARRILQEAGLPPEAMTDPDAPVTPPVYPDPPAGGGGGKRAYRPPRDRNRTIIRVLWVVAAVAVVVTGVRWLVWAFGYRQTAIDSVTYYTEESPVPDLAVQEPAFYQGDGYSRYEGNTASAVTGTADTEVELVTDPVTGNEYCFAHWSDGMSTEWRMESVAGEMLNTIRIDWPTGCVSVASDDSSFPWFRTRGGEAVWSIRGGELTISPNAGAEELEVWVPNWLSPYLEIETDSASVDLRGDTYGNVSVETGSGNVTLEGLVVSEDLEIATGSGSVSGIAEYLWNADVTTGSGDVELQVNNGMDLAVEAGSGHVLLTLMDSYANALDVETGSGDITLVLPEDAGFQLKWRTGNGDLSIGPFAMDQRSNGRYECGDGSIRIDAETSSGDLFLESSW